MSSAEDEVLKEAEWVLWGSSIVAQYEKIGGIYVFHRFSAGSRVVLDLAGVVIDSSRLGDDQMLAGDLVDPKLAVISVDTASGESSSLKGKIIQLGVTTSLLAPVGVVIPQILKGCVAPGREAVYYTDNGNSNDKLCLSDECTNLFAIYARLKVNDSVMFGEMYEPPATNM